MGEIQHFEITDDAKLHVPKTHNHDTLYLKRGANDFENGITEKNPPVANDRVLIEDAGDLFTKKWASLGNLLESTGGMAKSVYDSGGDGMIDVSAGGTGQSTAQAAIDALSQVDGATNEHVLTKDTDTGNASWKVAAGGGSTTWIDLTDTDPTTFAGESGKYVKVNAGATGLDFGTPSGSGDMTKAEYDPNGDGVIASAQLDTNVFLVGGSRAMAANIDMGTNMIESCEGLKGEVGGAGMAWFLSGDHSTGAWMVAYGNAVAGAYSGDMLFGTSNALETDYAIAAIVCGPSDTPLVEIQHGLDMNDKAITSLMAGTNDADAIRKDQALLLDGSQDMVAALNMNNNHISAVDTVTATKHASGDSYLIDEKLYLGSAAAIIECDDEIKLYPSNVHTATFASAVWGGFKIDKISELTGAAGITFMHTINMGTRRITGIGDPNDAQDAATRHYVDTTTGSWEVSGAELQMGSPRGMGMQGEDILYTGDVVPQLNGVANLGTASYLWANVFATNGVFGDLGFEEKECHICGKKFVVGDIIDLVIKSIEPHGVMTVPVHKECNS